MNKSLLSIAISPDPERDRKLIGDRLAADDGALSASSMQPLVLTMHDANDDLAAGLAGETYTDWLHVSFLWVHADQRGGGFGRALLDEAASLAHARGVRRMFLECRTNEGFAFYERLGFMCAGEIPDFIAGLPLRTYWKHI